jgi:hypothetical protein
MVWDYIYILCCVASSYLYAYLAAFGMPVFNKDIEKVLLALDIYFFLCIIKCFMTSYTNKDQQQVKDFWKIGKNYLRESFVMDIITWVPTQYIAK